MYVATINIPGYLPMDDEPPTFDTAREAWEYLADERRLAEDEFYDGGPDDGYSSTVHDLEAHADTRWMVCDFERVGAIHGPTPGYDGEHDLGLAYSVSEIEQH